MTPTTALSWAYTNTLVWNGNVEQDNASPAASDAGGVAGNSMTNAFSAGLQHWFGRDLSAAAGYTYSLTNSEEAGDTQMQSASADLAYLISPRTTASLRAFGTLIAQDQGASDVSTNGDAQIFGVSFGVRRQLTSFLSAYASLGPTVVDRQQRPTRLFANWQVSLDGPIPLTPRTNLNLSTQQSINDTAGDIDDIGLVLSQSATLTLTHAAIPRSPLHGNRHYGPYANARRHRHGRFHPKPGLPRLHLLEHWRQSFLCVQSDLVGQCSIPLPTP